MCHLQFGLGREYALFKAHHRETILKFPDLRFYFDSRRELNKPHCKIGACSNGERDTTRKTWVYFDETYVPAIPFALNVGGTDDLKRLRNMSGKCNNFGMLASNTFIADAGSDHEPFTRHD